MKKEHIIPISKEIAALILVQEQRVADELDDGCVYVFPEKIAHH